MNWSTSYKSKQFLWLVLKLLVVITCCYFIYAKIVSNKELHFSDFQSILINSDVFLLKNITFLLIFTIFNWFFEISKWRVLVEKICSISWRDAINQSLASASLALITPVRTGEYGMKILYFDKKYRKQVALQAFVGNIYQLLITLGIGFGGILFLRKFLNEDLVNIIDIGFWSLLIIGVLCILLRKRVSFIQQILNQFDVVFQKNNRRVFLLSLLRYLIFSHQFLFLVFLFDIEVSYWEAMSCITSMYLLTSVVPILPIFDFALKGSVSILLFSIFNANPIHVVTITAIMWILNFALPAIIGSYFVLKFKPIQTT